LDEYVKDDSSRAAYLNVKVGESSDGAWPPTVPPPAYDAYSPGAGDVTVWKGFQRNHAEGLELLQAAAARQPSRMDRATSRSASLRLP
jgi:hypothetical protein